MQDLHVTHISGWDFFTFLVIAPVLTAVIILLGEKFISYWEKRQKRNIERKK